MINGINTWALSIKRYSELFKWIKEEVKDLNKERTLTTMLPFHTKDDAERLDMK